MLPLGNYKNVLDPRQFERAVENALEATAKDIKVDYQVTTYTWKHQPKFVIKKDGKFERSIYTEDEIYGYVSGGTRPHEIRAKNAPMLVFQAGFSAKTRPGVIRSNKGGRFGPTIFTPVVHHPGTQARQFDKVISDKWAKQWPRNLERAVFAELL